MLRDQDEAHRALAANLSPRYHRIDGLERYVLGTQYDDRPHFWDDSVPLYERAPCVVHPIVASAIRGNTDLCLGEGRWPEITSHTDEDGTAFDPRFGLDEDASEKVNKLVSAISKQARLPAVCSELLDSAQGSKTSVAIGCIRKGRISVETTKAKWCEPRFDDSGELVSVEVCYPYLEEYRDTRSGEWAVRCLLYRRVIDANADTTYLPAKASENGEEPDSWAVDTAKTVLHGLGFVPVVWYRFRAPCATVSDNDGRAIHEELTDELDAYHFAVSQRHAAAMVAASPPTIEIGVDPDHNPAPMGRQAEIVIPQAYGKDGEKVGHAWVANGVGQVGSVRKRGPGIVWRYPSPETKVMQLVMAGDALKPVDDDARDLKAKIADGMAVVFVDPDNAKFSAELSGKAIARLYDRQIRSCDKIREDFGNGCLLPLVSLLLRICLKKSSGLYLGGLKECLPILAKFEQPVAADDGTVSVQWFAPDLDLAWGPYFEADAQDEKAIVERTKQAYDAGFVTKRSAVEEMSDIFTIGNVDEYLDALDEEAAEKAEKSLTALQDSLSLTHGPNDETEAGIGKVASPPGKRPPLDAPIGGKASAKPGGGFSRNRQSSPFAGKRA